MMHVHVPNPFRSWRDQRELKRQELALKQMEESLREFEGKSANQRLKQGIWGAGVSEEKFEARKKRDEGLDQCIKAFEDDIRSVLRSERMLTFAPYRVDQIESRIPLTWEEIRGEALPAIFPKRGKETDEEWKEICARHGSELDRREKFIALYKRIAALEMVGLMPLGSSAEHARNIREAFKPRRETGQEEKMMDMIVELERKFRTSSGSGEGLIELKRDPLDELIRELNEELADSPFNPSGWADKREAIKRRDEALDQRIKAFEDEMRSVLRSERMLPISPYRVDEIESRLPLKWEEVRGEPLPATLPKRGKETDNEWRERGVQHFRELHRKEKSITMYKRIAALELIGLVPAGLSAEQGKNIREIFKPWKEMPEVQVALTHYKNPEEQQRIRKIIAELEKKFRDSPGSGGGCVR
jgi:hypothetical protein